jgi:hypothetical protein
VNVVDIATRDSVDADWDAFRSHVSRSFDDHRLLLDRGYMEQWAVLEERFKKLSMMPRTY